MKIHPIVTNNDLLNIFYILEYGNKQAIVVDPSDTKLCQDFLDEHNLELQKVFITHEHHDHYEWVEWLGCSEVYAGEISSDAIPVKVSHIFTDGETIFEYENIKIKAVFAPGHAAGHMMFEIYESNRVTDILVWDVLFAGWVGNTYTWDSSVLYDSIQLFQKYSDDVVIYSGHDYLETNMNFIKTHFPENTSYVDDILAKKGDNIYFTSLWEEREVNPFFGVSREEFIRIRELRNTW
jgi:hydroxyacylglutathione hydrolase